jgi:Domain of unknown function (DUF4149)
MRDALSWMRLASAAWLGLLLCVGLLAAPVAFAVLQRPAAGQYVGALFAREAAASVVLAAVLMLLQRWRVRQAAASLQVDATLLLPAAALFCTLLGSYGLQPWLEQARAGTGPLSFGQLHAISVLLFGGKLMLVASLAWRLNRSAASSG